MEKDELDMIKVGKNIYEISSKKNDNKKIEDIIYYKELEFLKSDKKYFSFEEKDIFIIEKSENKDGKKELDYELYNKEGKLIANLDEKLNIEFTKEYKEKLKKMPKEYYDKIGFDKRKMSLEKIVKEKSIDKDLKKEYNDKTKRREEKRQTTKEEHRLSKEEKTKKMEEDLSIKEKDIKSSSEIRDEEFYRLVPEAKKFKGNVSIVYISSTNEFKLLGIDRKTGKYKELKSVLASQAVEQTSSIDLGRNGEKVKRESLKAVLKIKGNEEYSFAAKLEPYNPIEFKELRRDLHTGEYMSTNMQTFHQYPTTKEVDEMMKKEKNHDIIQEVETFEKKEKKGIKQTNINRIKDETVEKEKKIRQEEEQIKEKTIHDQGNKYYY